MSIILPVRGNLKSLQISSGDYYALASNLRKESSLENSSAAIVELAISQKSEKEQNQNNKNVGEASSYDHLLLGLTPELKELEDKVSTVLNSLGPDIAKQFKNLLTSAAQHQQHLSDFLATVSKVVDKLGFENSDEDGDKPSKALLLSQVEAAYSKSAKTEDAPSHDILA